MKRIVAVTSCPTGVAHTLMAAKALEHTAGQLGYPITVETQGAAGTRNTLSAEEIAAADVVLIAADIRIDLARFAGKELLEVSTGEAIRETRAVLAKALTLVGETLPAAAGPESKKGEAAASKAGAKGEEVPVLAVPAKTPRLVAVTSCPTGVAHTFMAAKALEKAAAALGYEMKVETQGSVGAKNTLTAADVAAADAVIIAADKVVALDRFGGKRLHQTGTKDAMHHGQDVIAAALALPLPSDAGAAGAGGAAGTAAQAAGGKAAHGKQRTGPYKHLMTGVSFMLPVVIAGGLCIALAFAVGGIHAGDAKGTLGAALSQIGGGAAFQMIVAVLGAYIAYSIADRPGIAPGLVGGMLAQQLGAGFIGGIAAGFMAGYLTKFLADTIRLPETLEGLKPVLILPLLSTVTVGLAMIYLVAPPVAALNEAMTAFLNNMRGTNAALLGVLLGAMMAFDMGGPVNKAAYTFAVGLLASGVHTPMAAVVAGGMTPPLGLALAATLFRNRFDLDERQAAGAAWVLGASFITEGAIPFAAKDPLRVIPSLMLGSAVAGALSMMAGVEFLVPHGGIFAVLIPGAVTHLAVYLGAIVAGTVVTAAALVLLKRPVPDPDTAPLVGPQVKAA